MSFSTLVRAAQDFAEDTMGEAFTLNNSAYTGVFNVLTKDVTLEDQGVRTSVDAIVVASKAQFSSAPATRDTVVYGGVTFSVRDVQDDTQAYTLQLKKLA